MSLTPFGIYDCPKCGWRFEFKPGDWNKDNLGVLCKNCGYDLTAEATIELKSTPLIYKENDIWMVGRLTSVARVIAIDAMKALGLNQDDWRTRDKIIVAISDRVNNMLDCVDRGRDESTRCT